MKRFSIILLTIILVSGLILGGCAKPSPTPAPAPSPVPVPASEQPAAKPIELKWCFHHPPMAFPAKSLFKPWIQQIEEESGGRVKITMYAGASLVKMHDEYNAVESGLADMANFVPDITPGRFPLCEIAMLPKLFPSGELAGGIFHELLNKYAVDTELKGVKLLWVLPLPPHEPASYQAS